MVIERICFVLCSEQDALKERASIAEDRLREVTSSIEAVSAHTSDAADVTGTEATEVPAPQETQLEIEQTDGIGSELVHHQEEAAELSQQQAEEPEKPNYEATDENDGVADGAAATTAEVVSEQQGGAGQTGEDELGLREISRVVAERGAGARAVQLGVFPDAVERAGDETTGRTAR